MLSPVAETFQGPVAEIAARIRRALEVRPEVLEAYLFGSVARGDAQRHSDVDVAVYLDESRPAAQGYGPAAEIAADVMAAPGENRVDLVALNRASPLL
jgi:hypothetical protein